MKLVLSIIIVLMCSCSEKKDAAERVGEQLANDEVTSVSAGDKKMKAAIKEARETVGDFIKVLNSNDSSFHDLSIKVPLEDGEEVEHVWLDQVKLEGDSFSGIIANDLKMVKNFKMGQSVTYKKNEITDWMYIKEGVVHGNITLKAMFHAMDPEEVKVIKKMMGWRE